MNGSIKAHPSSPAGEAGAPSTPLTMYTLSSLATRGARTPYHNRGEPVARLCPLSLSHGNRQRLNLWRRAKEGREPPPSSSSSSSIHPSLTLFLNKMRFFLLSQLGRKSLVCKQIEGLFVCSESIPVATAPSLTAAATQCSERDGNGRRACAGLVCNGEGRRAEGRSKATFPPRQKKHSIRRMNEGNWWRRRTR